MPLPSVMVKARWPSCTVTYLFPARMRPCAADLGSIHLAKSPNTFKPLATCKLTLETIFKKLIGQNKN